MSLEHDGQKSQESQKGREGKGRGRAALDETSLAEDALVIDTLDCNIGAVDVRSSLISRLPGPAQNACVAALSFRDGELSGFVAAGIDGSWCAQRLKVSHISSVRDRPRNSTRAVGAMASLMSPGDGHSFATNKRVTNTRLGLFLGFKTR